MPSPGNQFLSDEFGDIEDYFISDYQLIDQYIGDQLWGWGKNGYGQLGVNDTTQRNTPVTTLLGGTNWKQVNISSRYNTAAIKTDGTLWVWGANFYANLGTNGPNTQTPVTTFAGGNNWKQVSGGYYYTVAIKTDGTLWTWGNNAYGQLGVNDTTIRSTPVTTLLGGTNWKQVAGGNTHIAAIKTDGTLWTWGNNGSGQLGINGGVPRSTPVTTILGGTNWKQVSCGRTHTAAIKTDGTLWLWGEGFWGGLGVNDITNRSTPVTTLLGGTDWKQVSCGYSYTAAIKTDGTLWTWGRNTYGQLGVNDTTDRSTPVTTLLGGTNWKQVSCPGSGSVISTQTAAAIKTDGTLWTWGNNANGQLGVNDTTDRSTPVTTLLGGTNWKQVSAGYTNVAAVTAGQTPFVDFS